MRFVGVIAVRVMFFPDVFWSSIVYIGGASVVTLLDLIMMSLVVLLKFMLCVGVAITKNSIPATTTMITSAQP